MGARGEWTIVLFRKEWTMVLFRRNKRMDNGATFDRTSKCAFEPWGFNLENNKQSDLSKRIYHSFCI